MKHIRQVYPAAHSGEPRPAQAGREDRRAQCKHHQRPVRLSVNGLTLIEILIAIIILMIGLVGVLSLFPAGIKSAGESVDDRTAAGVAVSVTDALITAMRSATGEDNKNGIPSEVTFNHDGTTDGTGKDYYRFKLPLGKDPIPPKPRYYLHPDDKRSPFDTPKPADINPTKAFLLGRDKFIKSVYDKVRTESDPTDPYGQWGFAFLVSRLDDNRPKDETGPTYKPLPIFRFTIWVYRLGPTAATKTKDGYVQPSKGLPPPKYTFTIDLAGQ